MTTREIFKGIDGRIAGRVAMVLPVLVLAMTSVLRAEDVVMHWNKVMLATIAAGGTDPITSTRTAAIVQAAVFDSVNGIQRKYTPMHFDLRAPEDTSIAAAVIECAYATLVALYPDQQPDLRAERRVALAKLHTSREAIKRGQEFGALVAADILNWRSTDSFDSPPPPFLGGTNIGQWRPTPPDFRPGALPQVATMVPWSIKSPDQFRPPGPPSFTSARYAAAFRIDSERVPGVWRAFPSFSRAVLEVNDARVFAGIHYRTSCLDGNALGTEVARFVLRHSMRPESEEASK